MALGCASKGQGATSEVARTGPTVDEGLTPVDPAADPCADFARFACGPNASRTDETILPDDAYLRRLANLRHFLEEISGKPISELSPEAALVQDFYRRCTDNGLRDAGLGELAARVDAFTKIASVEDLARTVGALRAAGFNLLISLRTFSVRRDAGGTVAAVLGLGAPILPNALYARKHHLLQDYRQHWLRLGALSGLTSPDDVDAAVRIDALLGAEPAPPPRIPHARDHMFDAASLKSARFPWPAYFSGLGLAEGGPLEWSSDGDAARIDRVVTQPLSDLKKYLRVVLIERLAEFVSVKMLEEERQFHVGVVHNRTYQPELLAKVCTLFASRSPSMVLASAYLPLLSDPTSEEVARRLMDTLRRRADQRIRLVPWLDEHSRSATLRRIGALRLLLVSEAPAPDLSTLTMAPGSLLAFMLRERSWVSSSGLRKLGQPLKETLGAASFSLASYWGTKNLLWLSPEAVRRPFVRTDAFNATTFGALGSLVGWGIGDALAAAARQDDVSSETWSRQAIATYEARANCLTAATGGESTSPDRESKTDDLASELVGVALALEAMETDRARSSSGRPLEAWQREFFLAYAQLECRFEDEPRSEVEDLRGRQVPPRVRVNTVVANLPEFAGAFHCAVGTPLSPARRCEVW